MYYSRKLLWIYRTSTKALVCMINSFSFLKRHSSTFLTIRCQQLGTRKNANRRRPADNDDVDLQSADDGGVFVRHGTESKESPSGMVRIVSRILSIYWWSSNSSSFNSSGFRASCSCSCVSRLVRQVVVAIVLDMWYAQCIKGLWATRGCGLAWCDALLSEAERLPTVYTSSIIFFLLPNIAHSNKATMALGGWVHDRKSIVKWFAQELDQVVMRTIYERANVFACLPHQVSNLKDIIPSL